MNKELLFHIALTLVKGIGPVNAKKLVAYCGGVEAVFKEKLKAIEKIPNVGRGLAKEINQKSYKIRAEKEIKFIQKHAINHHSYWSENYPNKLRHCHDAPTLLFSKGNFDINRDRFISIVGTRKATPYGQSFCKALIKELKVYDPIIVSGLAYGIDKCAHKESLNNDIYTLGVLAHGLDTLYPKTHTKLVSQMIQKGGLITEFLSDTKIIRENFVRRNRIIAGLSEATIVLESGLKGGAMVTAKMANLYNREVFALPGKISDPYSKGCNCLIKNNQAHLLTNISDLVNNLLWDKKSKILQHNLFENTKEEIELIDIISNHNGIHIDLIHSLSKLTFNETNRVLMNLELKDLILLKPGKIYFKNFH